MKQPSSTRRKQTAKAVILFFLGISVLCSCQRGIDITKIEAMPEGAAKDSAMLYYYQGVRPGDFVIVKKSTKDELNEINDSAIPIYLTTSAEVKRDQDLNVTNKVCQIFRGDTLQIVGGYDKSLSREKFMQKSYMGTSISRICESFRVSNSKLAVSYTPIPSRRDSIVPSTFISPSMRKMYTPACDWCR